MKKLLVIVGPTATGKTRIGLELAKKFDGEIVSADSRQLYIGMDVGTGKSPNEKLEKHKGYWVAGGIPIHLYDVITPDKTFSVAEYQHLAYKTIDEIHNKKKLPILVGGTGLYVRAVTEGLKIPKAAQNKNLRKHLEKKPPAALLSELEQVDPATFKKIDKKNLRRVVRALEIYYQTGEPASELKEKFSAKYESLKIGLTGSRRHLYKRADVQIDSWFARGFVDEVKGLLASGYKETNTAMTSLGYRQVVMYLNDKISLEEARQRMKWEHHSYIRRQLTWFRKEANVHWFDMEEVNFKEQIFNLVESWLLNEFA